MRKLAVGALLAGALVACGSSNSKKTITPLPDGSTDGTGSGAACNVLTQSGCMTGQKCTWIEDNNAMPPLGHIGCVADGTAALGAACQYGPPGMTGFDNCTKGNICLDGVCKQICDQTGGSPMCATGFACGLYDGVFGPSAGPYAAGACDPTCDPFADNTFGLASKPGSGCGSQSGCYGLPDSTVPTHYTCGHPQTMDGNRTACTGACGPFLNGCGQGYVPLLIDQTGSQQVDCISYCKPADCSSAGCGTAGSLLPGDTANGSDGRRHQCRNSDSALGTYSPATVAPPNNGDQCVYEWFFDINTMGQLVKSATQDTVGFCFDHSKYGVPTNPSDTTTMCTGPNSPAGCSAIPRCDTMPVMGGSAAYGAADWGCVSTTTGGIMLGNKPHIPQQVDLPRPLYHATIAHH